MIPPELTEDSTPTMRTKRNSAIDTKKAIGYIRVSIEEQAQEGVSLPVQEAQIRSYC